MTEDLRKPAAGVYVHWPFCERKCPYCDFYTFGREHPWADWGEKYAAALLKEIDSLPARLNSFLDNDDSRRLAGRIPADTVFFGGGTPSLMPASTFGAILGAIKKHFALAPDSEITLEINPTTAEAAQVEGFLAQGLNRVSVGSQSFNDRILKALGRVHDAATTRRAIARLRAAGIANLSLDIIFAAPDQTQDELERDIDELLAFAPEHISAYNLTLHEGTPMARWAAEGKLALPENDAQAGMYELLIDRLAAAGYEHYEISNWARPGRRSRHNSKYWRDCNVFGFGPSAHGVVQRRRFENPRDLRAYLEKPGDLMRPADPPANARAGMGEIMMLALRRVEGAAWEELNHWAGCDLRAYYAAEIKTLRGRELISCDMTSIAPTRLGLMLANKVAAEFF